MHHSPVIIKGFILNVDGCVNFYLKKNCYWLARAHSFQRGRVWIWERGRNNNTHFYSFLPALRILYFWLNFSLDFPCTEGRSYAWKSGNLNLGGIGNEITRKWKEKVISCKRYVHIAQYPSNTTWNENKI